MIGFMNEHNEEIGVFLQVLIRGFGEKYGIRGIKV